MVRGLDDDRQQRRTAKPDEWPPDELDDVLANATPVRPRARGRVADVADVADASKEPAGDLGEVLDELTAHLRRFVSFQRPEQADAVEDRYLAGHASLFPDQADEVIGALLGLENPWPDRAKFFGRQVGRGR